jgi:hypothetical protein
MATLSDIPKDVWLIIVNNLDNYSKVLLRRTCHLYYFWIPLPKVSFGDVFKVASNLENLEYFLQDLLNFPAKQANKIVENIVRQDSYENLMIWKRYATRMDLETICDNIKFNGEIWNHLEYYFISSYDTIAFCLSEWSGIQKKNTKWILKHGVTLEFLSQAFETKDTRVYIAIIFDTKLFRKYFSFSKKEIDILQKYTWDNYDFTLEDIGHNWEYISPYVCEDAKRQNIHKYIDHLCDCSRKLKKIKL